jgi:hypothetical protein
MSVVALERDADTTITHFAHREEFGQLLAAFFKRLDGHGAEELHVLVRQMGAIVSSHFADVIFVHLSSTTTFPYLGC